jgi:lipoprotein-releasing system ATP-binding protein
MHENTPAAASPLFCEARNITKIYDSNLSLEVLRGVDLVLHRGEMVAIVGASGTGKTTLLHILGALDRPNSGQLFFEGRDVFAKNDQELSVFRNRAVGFVFQFHHLLPEFTAQENVMLPGLIAAQEKETLQQQAFDILSRVGLGERTRHMVGELSGGEQQRVALARALIMKPALLLADEPTGNLDPKTGQMVFETLREMTGLFSLTTVMVTHNYDLARQMNRCFRLSDGKLQEEHL